jgi:hypothetical protein
VVLLILGSLVAYGVLGGIGSLLKLGVLTFNGNDRI